jgi:hypothetical protein
MDWDDLFPVFAIAAVASFVLSCEISVVHPNLRF